ncbi:MAG: hypothetical protein P4M13_05075 [Alphaproteobacteria bacterium]|nr:hypothetical protein [Alphaproteobacteria bacterium]
MNYDQEEKPIRYTLRIANYEDLPYIVKFFQDPRKPSTVFERTPEAFGAAINNDLMLLLTTPEGNIAATGAVHILPGCINIGSTVTARSCEPQPMSLDVNFAEIGSIWRPGEKPAGFCLDLIYNACILQTYLKANDLLISALVTQVVANNDKGIKRLLQLKQGWESFVLNAECTHQFQNTIADSQSKTITLESFYTPAGVAIVKAAHCLLGASNNSKFARAARLPGVIQALDMKANKIVEINLGSTRLLTVAQQIVDLHKTRRLKPLVNNRRLPWFAAEKQVNAPANSASPPRLKRTMQRGLPHKVATAATPCSF